MVNFDTREGIMKQWDRWVKYYKAGGGVSWPRDAFESLLDYFEERIRQVSGKSSKRKCPWPCTDMKAYGGRNFCPFCGRDLRL